MRDSISKEVFKNAIQPLEEAFGFKMPKMRLVYLYDALKHNSAEQLEDAVRYLINNNNRMPLNADIITAVGKEREIAWERTKDKEKEQARDFFQGKYCRTDLARDAISCINKMLEEKTTPNEKVELMLGMEKKYPDIGYKQECFKMKKQFEKIGKL